jgi:hypothetical protein
LFSRREQHGLQERRVVDRGRGEHLGAHAGTDSADALDALGVGDVEHVEHRVALSAAAGVLLENVGEVAFARARAALLFGDVDVTLQHQTAVDRARLPGASAAQLLREQPLELGRLGRVEHRQPGVLVEHGAQHARLRALVDGPGLVRERPRVLEQHGDRTRRVLFRFIAVAARAADDLGAVRLADVDDHEAAGAVGDVGVRPLHAHRARVEHRHDGQRLQRRLRRIEHAQPADAVGDVQRLARIGQALGLDGRDELRAARRGRIADVEHVDAARTLGREDAPREAAQRIAVEFEIDDVGQDELRDRGRGRELLAVERYHFDAAAVGDERELAREPEVGRAQAPRRGRAMALDARARGRTRRVHLVVHHGHARQAGRGHRESLVDQHRALLVAHGAHGRKTGQIRRETARIVQARVEALPGREDLLLRRDAALGARAGEQVELRQRLVAIEVEADEVGIPTGVARVALELGVHARHRFRGLAHELGPLGIDHLASLRHEVLLAIDLALQDHRVARAAQVLERRAALRAKGRRRRERAVAIGAGDLDRVLHRAVELAVAHHVALRVAVDAVHALLVVDVGRADRGVVEVEGAVAQRRGGPRDLRAARRARRKLREPAEVEPDRRVAVVTAGARVGRRRAGHRVHLGMAGLVAHRALVGALGQTVDRVGHVARGATLAAVVAVEADATAHGAAFRPQVALHALLARQVEVVAREFFARQVVAEGGDLAQFLDVAGLGLAGGDAEHRKRRELLLVQAHLVEAVGQVARGRRVHARVDALDLRLVARAAGRGDDAQVHRIDEAAPGEVLIGRSDALVTGVGELARHVREQLVVDRAVAAVAIDARDLLIGVHLLDARVAVQAAVDLGRQRLGGGHAVLRRRTRPPTRREQAEEQRPADAHGAA